VGDRRRGEEANRFEAAQHAYIERTHYAVLVDRVKRACGLEIASCARAVQDAAWSTAVQHGPRCTIIADAFATLTVRPGEDGFDRALIDAIYAERGRRDPNGRLAHFRGNSVEVQESVARRFRNERNDAIAMLDAENAKSALASAVLAKGPEAGALLRRVAAKMNDEDAYRLVEKHGDDEARSDWMAGRKVAVALRRPTNWTQALKGAYDDPFLLIWREETAVKVERFWCTTEPAGAYASGRERAAHGPTIDLDGDGRTDLGRLCPGVYHYRFERHPRFGPIYKARDIQVVDRDVNQDGSFSARDPTGAERTMYIHRGGARFTGSAGCQTLAPDGYARLRKRLGGQETLSYLLIDAE